MGKKKKDSLDFSFVLPRSMYILVNVEITLLAKFRKSNTFLPIISVPERMEWGREKKFNT